MKMLSIIIVTYNSVKDILDCIDAVYERSDIPEQLLEILVIDNSSREIFDVMNKMIVNKYNGRIKVIHNNENKGYGQGNNIGMMKSKSNIVCIINPDVILQSSIFSKVIKDFNNDPNLAMIGGKQFGGINLSFWIRPEFEFFLITVPLCIFLNKLNFYFQKYFFLSGALLFIDKNKFKSIGMFDESLFLYCEEADVTKRLLMNGFKTKFDKSIIYRHLIDDRQEVGEHNFNLQMQSIKYYLQKYNFSFLKFINNRLLSYKLLKFVSKILSNKNLERIALKNLSFLNNLKKNKY